MYQYHYERPTPHLLFDIAQGKMYDSQPVNIFGFNRTVATSFETVWNDGGTYAFPSAALTMTIVSSSASDTMAVLVVGLDASYNEVRQIVTLTGTGAVTIPTALYRINSAVILAGSNVGDITIASGGVTYGYIEADLGTTQACLYTVPAGYDLYLFRITANSATAAGSKYVTIRNALQNSVGRWLKVAEATFSQSQVNYDRQVPFQIAEKTDFMFEAKSSASTNEVSIFVEAVLVKHNG
tara:strand:- start:2157 stop:2873 length:717 start_codon:yes stop_codon:yes gene_type:complete